MGDVTVVATDAPIRLEQVHPRLVIEHAARTMRTIQWALDGVGLRQLAHDTGHLAGQIEAAAILPPEVA